MGAASSRSGHEKGYKPPTTGSTEDGPMVALVEKRPGAANVLIFEHAQALESSPGGRPLTLKSHPGLAIVPRYDYPRSAKEWRYIEIGIGPAHMAMTVKLEDQFLVRVHDERVMDIAHWNYEAGNTLYGGGGRSFVVNNDGSISPALATHLVLGMQSPTLSFVNREDPKVCRFEHAEALRAGATAPLTLSSHPD